MKGVEAYTCLCHDAAKQKGKSPTIDQMVQVILDR